MAVRNLEAIQRQGTMIAEQKRNEYQLRKDFFWKRVNIIRDCHDDAVDFVDTVKALGNNGLLSRFEKWCEKQNVEYRSYCDEFTLYSNNCTIHYNPIEDYVSFSWSAHGMCESYSTNKYQDYANGGADGERYLIDCVTKKDDDRTYNDLLTKMSERLQPFINAFFDWLESI